MRILLKVGPILQADESNCSPSKTTEKKAKKVAYLLGWRKKNPGEKSLACPWHSPHTWRLDAEVVLVHFNAEKSKLAPISAPWISANPIFCSGFVVNTPADDADFMIQMNRVMKLFRINATLDRVFENHPKRRMKVVLKHCASEASFKKRRIIHCFWFYKKETFWVIFKHCALIVLKFESHVNGTGDGSTFVELFLHIFCSRHLSIFWCIVAKQGTKIYN